MPSSQQLDLNKKHAMLQSFEVALIIVAVGMEEEVHKEILKVATAADTDITDKINMVLLVIRITTIITTAIITLVTTVAAVVIVSIITMEVIHMETAMVIKTETIINRINRMNRVINKLQHLSQQSTNQLLHHKKVEVAKSKDLSVVIRQEK